MFVLCSTVCSKGTSLQFISYLVSQPTCTRFLNWLLWKSSHCLDRLSCILSSTILCQVYGIIFMHFGARPASPKSLSPYWSVSQRAFNINEGAASEKSMLECKISSLVEITWASTSRTHMAIKCLQMNHSSLSLKAGLTSTQTHPLSGDVQSELCVNMTLLDIATIADARNSQGHLTLWFNSPKIFLAIGYSVKSR